MILLVLLIGGAFMLGYSTGSCIEASYWNKRCDWWYERVKLWRGKYFDLLLKERHKKSTDDADWWKEES